MTLMRNWHNIRPVLAGCWMSLDLSLRPWADTRLAIVKSKALYIKGLFATFRNISLLLAQA